MIANDDRVWLVELGGGEGYFVTVVEVVAVSRRGCFVRAAVSFLTA